MSWGMRGSLVGGMAALICAGCLIAIPAARADPVLKAGNPADTNAGNCAPTHIVPSYSQQVSGTEPKVNDVFYISVRMDLSLITFDCAAEFYSILADLPTGVSPAIGGSATMICRRWGFNNAGQQVNDQRSQNNCPTSAVANGNGEFSMRPVNSPVLPDVGGAGGGYWFAGIRSPQESQSYTHVQVLVPVKSTVTMTGQPISFLVCGVGSSCETVTVPLTVTAGPVNADPPLISLPAAAQTTAIGARVPFTINDNATGSSYYIKLDTSTNAAFPPATAAGRPCGLTDPVAYQNSATSMPFSGSSTFEAQFGDLQTGGTTCYLTPDTTYNFKVCTSNPATAFPFTDFAGCRTTQFSTGAVNVTLEMPATPPFTTTPTAKVRVLAGHPAGTIKVQSKPKAGGTFSDSTNATAMVQSTLDSAISNQPFTTALSSWRTYEVRACFISGAHQPCSTPIDYTTGNSVTGDSTSVTYNSAVLSGTPSSPNPPLAMSALVSTTDPGTADPRVVMNPMGSGSIATNNSVSPNSPVSATVTGLQPQTTYFWTACFDNNNAGPDPEACGAVKSFTTAATPPFCELNPNDPSCTPDPCDDNPADPACTPDPCDDIPKPESCNPPGKAELTIGKITQIKVKRGKSGKVRVPVVNTSSTGASGVTVCLKLATRFKGRLKLPGCAKPGTLAAGKTATAALAVRAAKKAKAGIVTLSVKVAWTDGSKSGSARVRVVK